MEEKIHQKSAGAGTMVDVPVIWTFQDLEPGAAIELEITDDLRERLHVDAPRPEIVVEP